MERIIELANNLGKLNILFLFLAITSILLAIYFYVKSKREKKPVYSLKTSQLINNNLSSIDKLEITYDGNRLENLSLTKFAFWNAGKETIKEEDIVKFDPIKISVSENLTIYDYKIEIQDEKNNIRIEQKKDSSLLLAFDYLDKNDGVLFTIYHNGKNSDEIKVSGTCMGAFKITIGAEREKISNSLMDIKAVKFFENLVNNKNLFLNILGLISILPFVLYGVFIVTPFLLIDKFYDRFYNKSPKEFYLKEH